MRALCHDKKFRFYFIYFVAKKAFLEYRFLANYLCWSDRYFVTGGTFKNSHFKRMKKMLKLPFKMLSLSLSFIALTAAAQDSPSRFLSTDEAGARSSSPDIPVDQRVIVPEEAKQRFDNGAAPFYIKLRSYSRYLNTAFSFARPESEAILKEESGAIGLGENDLENLNNHLAKLRTIMSENTNASLTRECGVTDYAEMVSNDDAKQILERLDNRDDAGNAIAASILGDISRDHGDAVARSAEARILEWGESLSFTRVSTVGFVETSFGSDYQGYLKSQCESIH